MNCGCKNSLDCCEVRAFQAQVIKLLNAIYSMITTVVVSPITPATAGTETVTRLTATGSGTITQGALGVAITNVGSSNGVVQGEPIYPNQSVNLGAIYSNSANIFYYLPEISYDGTGTTLSITVLS